MWETAFEGQDRKCESRVDYDNSEQDIAAETDGKLRFDISDKKDHDGLRQGKHRLKKDVAGVCKLSESVELFA